MTRILALSLALFLAVPAAAQVGKSLGVVDANTVAEADLAKLPGMTPAIAKAVVAARPFESSVDLNKFLLSQKLTQEQANEIYKHAFIHINLNTATAPEIMLVPGAGKRMAHEFEEYRPWKSWAQFEKEIGKYVDAKDVVRLAHYSLIPPILNTPTGADFIPLPCVVKRMRARVRRIPPVENTGAVREGNRQLIVDAKEVKRFWRYVVIP